MAKKRSKIFRKEISHKRRPWTPKEDAAIRVLVKENGVKQWTLIAENLDKKYNITGRSGKQCRERWHNHLNTGIVKHPWDISEEFALFSTHQSVGNKWAEISKAIPGRTDNSIKNHFYSTVRKFYRKIYGKEGNSDELKKNLGYITESIFNSLIKEKQIIYEEKPTSDSADESFGFPDFSDIVVNGQPLKLQNDWPPQDFGFNEDQEIMIFPISPYESYFLN